jgi:hypothetical protein
MKTKLFALAVLLLLVLSFAPVFSYTPPEPGYPTVNYIEPQELTFTGPCCDTQTFTADDIIYNIKDMWAWDVNITWDTMYINITSWELHVPAGWPVDGYMILFNELYKTGVEPNDMGLHFAVTGLAGKATNFTGTMSLVTMNFKVLFEPCWPTTITTYITKEKGAFWTGCGAPIKIDETHHGKINLVPSKPNIEVLFSDKFDLTKKAAQGWKENQVITAYVWISNATKLHDIRLDIAFNDSLLDIDLQQITINTEAFPMPWKSLSQGWDAKGGLKVFKFYIERPYPEKPGLKGTFWIIKMDFKVKCVTDSENIPVNASTLIEPLRWDGCLGSYLSMCGTYYWAESDLDISKAKYYWTPIQYDFSQDGHVGKEDILLLLKHYGFHGTTGWDLNGNTYVDIGDVVLVAKAYCNDKPPVLAKDSPYVP